MPFLAETTVQTRLEDLERAGLVERSPSKPPFPKHAWITKKGEAVIESAVAAAVEALAPVMTTAAIAEPECVKETGG
jgi:DNA-binding HxlR family transcriptional regulator